MGNHATLTLMPIFLPYSWLCFAHSWLTMTVTLLLTLWPIRSLHPSRGHHTCTTHHTHTQSQMLRLGSPTKKGKNKNSNSNADIIKISYRYQDNLILIPISGRFYTDTIPFCFFWYWWNTTSFMMLEYTFLQVWLQVQTLHNPSHSLLPPLQPAKVFWADHILSWTSSY